MNLLKSHNEVLILVCTYNELSNIKLMLPLLCEHYGQVADVLVIDDNSPDGTSSWVQEYSQYNDNIKLLVRNSKQGRGSASRAGYQYFLESSYKYIIEIDADFSHDYLDISRMLKLKDKSDIVVGSRLVKGGSYGNYPLRRVLLSNLVIFLFRAFLKIPCKDAVQSFHLINKNVFERLRPSMLSANGFSVYVELKYLATQMGFKILEFPIKIQERTLGESKLGFKDQVKSVVMTLKNIYEIRKKKNDRVVEYRIR